jgi:hypothetical protein
VGVGVGLRLSTGFCGSAPTPKEGVTVTEPDDTPTADGEAGPELGAEPSPPVVAAVPPPGVPELVEGVGRVTLGPAADPQEDSAHAVTAITTTEATPPARAQLIAHTPHRFDAPWSAQVPAWSARSRARMPGSGTRRGTGLGGVLGVGVGVRVRTHLGQG